MTGTEKKLNLQIDLRHIIAVLMILIVSMLFLWQPWQANQPSDRTIKVTGETTVLAEPDRFVFYPNYEFNNDSNAGAIKESTQKSNEIVAKLKELGVEERSIKTNANGYNQAYYPEQSPKEVYNLQLTITVDDYGLAQKVQDYLLTTTPSGSITPQASFSESKYKELSAKARDEATKDARAKAEQSAKNLGFKIGAVKSVEDGSGFGDIIPLERGIAMDAGNKNSMPIQAGENELRYSVTVIYYVR
jgi:uncharacterized protein YggE